MLTTSQESHATTTSDAVFISYSRQDKAWVDGYLRRLFDAANVSYVIDEQDFQIGVPLDQNIRKLIKQCRFTLLVMTPDWVRGKWTHFEAELASDDNPEPTGFRVLPIMLRACDVPPKIAPNLYLDISQARGRDLEIGKLLQQLGVPADRIEHARASVAKKPLWFLIELLTEPTACDHLSEVDKKLEHIRQSNDILTMTKGLHDDLQAVQYPLKEVMKVLDNLGGIKAESDWNDSDWKSVHHPYSPLSQNLKRLVNFAATVSQNLVDVNFAKPIAKLSESIQVAFRCDARSFSKYIHSVSNQIGQALPRVNDRIIQHVKGRRLNDLVRQLQSIYELVADIEFDNDVIEILRQFRATIEELVALEKLIQEEVEDHGTFQNAESTLHLCDPDADPTFEDIQENWDHVNAFVAELKLTTRYGSLVRQSQELSNQLRDDKIVRDDRFESSVKWGFMGFADEMKNAFNKLDIDLKADCEKLKPRSDELSHLLKRMQPNDVHN